MISHSTSKTASLIVPGAIIGIIGGGQLGAMMAAAARTMGYRIAVLDPDPTAPTAAIADHVITAPYNDPEAARQLAVCSDIVTYEFEHIDLDTLALIAEVGCLPQGSELIRISQHRRLEKEAITALGLPVAPYANIVSIDDLDMAMESIRFPAVLKTCMGGYDGKGQVVVKHRSELEDAWQQLGSHAPLVLEQWIPFEREISVIVARSTQGETRCLPTAENEHCQNILHRTQVPARIAADVDARAQQIAMTLAEGLKLVGTLAVELFVGRDGTLYVNELAPRPHNSGHFSIDACETSQFEQHVRAICGLPLGDTRLLSPVVMENILGQHIAPLMARLTHLESLHLHLYGKARVVSQRKMGHLTALGPSTADCMRRLDQFWASAVVEAK